MSSPDFNPYAPPAAELRDIVPVPNGCVRVGSLFVVRKGSEHMVPADTCVCCGEPAAEARRITYTWRPRWQAWIWTGVFICVLINLRGLWSAAVLFVCLAAYMYTGKASGRETSVRFGECSRHLKIRSTLNGAGWLVFIGGPVLAVTFSLLEKSSAVQALVWVLPAMLLGLVCTSLASGFSPRVRHIDARKSIFAGCGRRWLEQFPER